MVSGRVRLRSWAGKGEGGGVAPRDWTRLPDEGRECAARLLHVAARSHMTS